MEGMLALHEEGRENGPRELKFQQREPFYMRNSYAPDTTTGHLSLQFHEENRRAADTR